MKLSLPRFPYKRRVDHETLMWAVLNSHYVQAFEPALLECPHCGYTFQPWRTDGQRDLPKYCPNQDHKTRLRARKKEVTAT